MKKEIQNTISLKTNYGKAIIRQIIMDRGYTGDIEKLKTRSNLNINGEPKKMRIRNHQEEYTDVIAYYYKDGHIDLITTGNYLAYVRNDRINKVIAPELCITVTKKKREQIEPQFIPEVGKLYVGSSYYSDNDCIIIITGKTPKQFKYKSVACNYIPTKNESLCGYTKTIEELTTNGYSVLDFFSERTLRLSIDGSWIHRNFSITQSQNVHQEGLYDRMSR